MVEHAKLRCIDPDCGAESGVDRSVPTCPACGGLVDVVYDWARAHSKMGFSGDPKIFQERNSGFFGAAVAEGAERLDASGVWRFRELLPFFDSVDNVVSVGEGRTILQPAPAIAKQLGYDAGKGGGVFLQYEGMNPSGSFKDNGMTGAFTHAKMIGATRAVCASTGNTSASLAMFAAISGVKPYVLIGEGKIAFGKLAQALEYGATTLQVEGDFDTCLKHVREIGEHRPELGIYLMNSVNPFRLEGQKAIMFRVLEALGWEVPDWIVVPGGNLGNCSAFAKAFTELKELGMVERIPRLAVINAHGARTLDKVYNELGVRWNSGRYDKDIVRGEYERMDKAGERASTIASAIEINRPVNLPKALRALEIMNGVVRCVDDETIMEYKALVGRNGFGCEPASGASVAGAHILREEGVIDAGERVVCILTGHLLKDPDVVVKYHSGIDTKAGQDLAPRGEPTGKKANRPIPVADDIDAIIKALGAG
jgi:threonine synthase